MNAHVTIPDADQRASDLESAAHDVLMRAEIMLTLADRFWRNISDDTRGRLICGSFYEELSFQMHEVHKAAIVMHKATA